MRRWPVTLGDKDFWAAEELFHFFGIMLSSQAPHQPLRGGDLAAVLDLLSHHPVTICN